MQTPNEIKRQIDEIVAYLVEVGLADDQHFAIQRRRANGVVDVTFDGEFDVSIALKDQEYDVIYEQLARSRAYNIKMPDGALIQMMYQFSKGSLYRHRLAFFPSPHLEEFQNNPDIYLYDEIYADVIARNVVPFPLRFDYTRICRPQKRGHPKAHLTLGQYRNCRIPVTAPMTPVWFADCILRSFYHTAFTRYADKLPGPSGSFPEVIMPSERGVVHVVVPI